MSKRSRDKGKRGERELASLLTAAGFPATRGEQYHGGTDSPDVRCPCLPGIHWEAKRTERLRLYEAVAQARHDAGDKLPVVAHKANHREWLAILPLSDLLAILRESEYCDCHEQRMVADDGSESAGFQTASNIATRDDHSPGAIHE